VDGVGVAGVGGTFADRSPRATLLGSHHESIGMGHGREGTIEVVGIRVCLGDGVRGALVGRDAAGGVGGWPTALDAVFAGRKIVEASDGVLALASEGWSAVPDWA
jgi:hypothetical protein